MNIAIIFAGGKGMRMGSEVPKQFLELDGEPILANTIRRFEQNENIDKIYVSTRPEYIDFVKRMAQVYQFIKVVDVVEGGETALDSQYLALERACDEKDNNPKDSIVLMHDGVRPFISNEIIDKVIEGVRENGNSITAVPATETVFVSNDGKTIETIPPRQNCYLAKAPQGYRIGELLEAFHKIQSSPEGYGDCTDSCSIMRKCGKDIFFVPDGPHNIKITRPIDIITAKEINKALNELQIRDISPTEAKLSEYNGGGEGR